MTSHQPSDGSTDRALVRRIGETFEDVQGRSYQNANVLLFDGVSYVFSHRAILTLVTTAACNAACKFCSNEITFTPGGPYLRPGPALDRILAFATLAGVRKVAFTGGEPTANPQRLVDLVRVVAGRFARARLHTNGYGLQRPVGQGPDTGQLLPTLIDLGLTGASISVAHFEPATNRELMRIKGGWAGMSDDDLRWVAGHSATGRFSARLSCVLTPGGVSGVDDIVDYVEWGRSLGFRSFIFRSCAQIPEPYRKATDFSVYNEDSHQPIAPLVERLARKSAFEETYRQHKSDSHVHVYRYRGDTTVDIDESSEELDPDPKVRRLIVMPDGVTYTSWVDPLCHLFPDEAEQVGASARRELPLLFATTPS